jgi:hypothetical protein
MRILETVCRSSTLGYSSILSTSLGTAHWLGVDRAFNSSIIFTSNPLTVGSMKPLAQAIALFLGLVQIAQFSMPFPNIRFKFSAVEHFGAQFKLYRYTNLMASNGSTAVTPGVQAFVPIINDETGCQSSVGSTETWWSREKNFEVHSHRVVKDGSSIFVSYDSPVPYLGFSIVPEHGDDVESTSSFRVYASNHDGGDDVTSLPEKEWTLIGMPTWNRKMSTLESR